MNHTTIMAKSIAGFCFVLLTGLNASAQFIETMGTAGSSPETIATRETNNRFDQISHTYSGTADARNTTPSTGYVGASGGFNILLQAQETFIAAGINASKCGTADSLSFGVFKSTNASTGVDYLVLEYSVDNGTTWVNLPFAALPTGSGTSKWYLRKIALPTAAQIPSLTLRFRSTLTGSSSAIPQFRIDDVSFTCGTSSNADCSNLTSLIESDYQTIYCAELGTNHLTVTTNMTSPTYQWYNQNGAMTGQNGDILTVNASGTYYVKISNADGCQLTSAKTYVLIYPQPAFCPISVSGCAGDTVQACATPVTNGLIISEYVEGTGNNKYLELYNGTCNAVNLSDYVLRAYHNGITTPTYTIALSGTLAAGDVYVIANTNATMWSGTPDLVTNNLAFNGNDALVLYNTATSANVDIFGVVGYDPGSAWRDITAGSPTLGWTTENKTLVRKPCVYSGIVVNPDLSGIAGFPTLFTEWDTLSTDNVSGLGAHQFGASSYAFSVASGSAQVISSTANCAQIIIGADTSTIAVDATFCSFNDCSELNNLITVTDTCPRKRSSEATTQLEETMATVYPNPFNETVTVELVMSEKTPVTITITDLSGKAVFVETNSFEAGKQRVSINVSNLENGTYICTIQTGNQPESFRIVKSH